MSKNKEKSAASNHGSSAGSSIIAEGSNGENYLLETIRKGYELNKAYFEVKVDKAEKKEHIKTVLDLEQLTGRRFEKFYVDTDDIRDTGSMSSMTQLLGNPLNPFTKLLFSGFNGSGKTTELIKLCLQLEDQLNIIVFSVWNRLRIHEITIQSLLFEIVEDAMQHLLNYGLVDESDLLLKDIVDNISRWCSETLSIEETQKEEQTSLGVGIEILKGVFFRAKTESRSGSSDKVVTTYMEERKLNDLIFECNKIFDYLKAKTGKETLIVIDDLEKMSFLKAREFYLSNASFIRDINCKMVMTIPVELVFHSDFAVIQNVFDEAEVLPMIKIKERDDSPYEPGIHLLKEILAQRIDLSLFENQCYLSAIKYSGGALRELFRIVKRAALIEKSAKITEASMDKAIYLLMDKFASRIQERNEPIAIKFQELLDILFEIRDGNKTSPTKNNALLDLLRTRAVMKYNGRGFYDTHPLLDPFIEEYKKKQERIDKREKGED